MSIIKDESKSESAASASTSASLRYKDNGNRFFAMKNFSAALACYNRGLEELPLDEGMPDEEIRSLEVALRSNAALSLLKLATPALAEGGQEETSQSPERYEITKQQRIEFCIDCKRECSQALRIDPANTKVLFRRAQSCELLAKWESNHEQSKNLLLEAQNDLKQCDKLLQEQLDRQKWSNTSGKTTKATIQQIIEAKKLLETISQSNILAEEQSSNPLAFQSEAFGGMETELSPADCKSNNVTDSPTLVNGVINCVQENQYGTPSPSHQRECIIQLLSRKSTNPTEVPSFQIQQYSPIVNEAYFLLNMKWWEKWCQHVNFFKMYTQDGNNDGNQGMPSDGKADAREIADVDMFNENMLSLLPPGATVPPYIDKDRKEKLGTGKKEEKRRGSMSSSSSDSSDDDSLVEQDVGFPPPGVIDNSMLMLENKSLWGHDFLNEIDHHSSGEDSNTKHGEPKQQHLQDHLVRGYHFEVIPREAYAALRCWYGECTSPICRRAVDAASLPWTAASPDSPAVMLVIYPEHWDIGAQTGCFPTQQQYPLKKVSKCGACRSPSGRFRCTRCFSVRYCDKSCQMSHWPYHKSVCQSLNKQRLENESHGIVASDDRGLIPEAALWGRVGLNNLGNTCFMSSAVQCMSHVAPLTRYFLSNKFENDINENNILGTGGKVANAYGAVMKDVWMGGHQHRNISPTVLKRSIELFAPRFSGVSQQDSAEFLAYLLDALHEDLNRIRNPPYVEMPDVEKGKKLSICGAEAWDAISLRNSSFVFDHFYGLYKSTCVCPQCEAVSVTFETFNHITLEIPRQLSIDVVVVLVRDCGESGAALPMRHCFQISPNGVMKDLKAALSQVSGIALPMLTLCSVCQYNITGIFKDQEPISVAMNSDVVVAYETAPCQDSSAIHAVTTHNVVNGDDTSRFGFPLLVSFDSSQSCAYICEKIWNRVKPFLLVGRTELPEHFTLENTLKIGIADASGRAITSAGENPSPLYVSSTSNSTLNDLVGKDCTKMFVFLVLQWSNLTVDGNDLSRINYKNFDIVTNHPSFLDYQQRLHRFNGANAVTLDQCFTSFTQPERLDDENMWYCTHCKTHVRAMKTVRLWRLPNILVIHLKRFEYRNTFSREKIGVLVDFPLEGLDLGKHSATAASDGPSKSDFVVDDVPLVYDLFGVTNHYGRMGFGHYTAYARRWDESGVENTWVEFDDENVVNLDVPGAVVSPAAYVLFYKRRAFK